MLQELELKESLSHIKEKVSGMLMNMLERKLVKQLQVKIR